MRHWLDSREFNSRVLDRACDSLQSSNLGAQLVTGLQKRFRGDEVDVSQARVAWVPWAPYYAVRCAVCVKVLKQHNIA